MLGENQTSIAKKVGCTRQYVSLVKKNYNKKLTPGGIHVKTRTSTFAIKVKVYNTALAGGSVEHIDRSLVRNITGRDRNRELVRIRDKHTCQSCRKVWATGRKLDVHHTDGLCGKKSMGYDSLEECKLLVTLCHKCHYNHHEHTLSKHIKV